MTGRKVPKPWVITLPALPVPGSSPKAYVRVKLYCRVVIYPLKGGRGFRVQGLDTETPASL